MRGAGWPAERYQLVEAAERRGDDADHLCRPRRWLYVRENRAGADLDGAAAQSYNAAKNGNGRSATHDDAIVAAGFLGFVSHHVPGRFDEEQPGARDPDNGAIEQ